MKRNSPFTQKAVIRLEKMLFKKDCEIMKIRKEFVEMCKSMEYFASIDDDLNEMITSAINKYKPAEEEMTMWFIDDKSELDKWAQLRRNYITYINEEYIKGLKDKNVGKEENDYSEELSNYADSSERLGLNIYSELRPSHPGNYAQECIIPTTSMYDKDKFINLIQNMTYPQFEKFCKSLRRMQEFCDMNAGCWATDVPWFHPEGKEHFWKLSYLGEEESED